MLRLKKTKTLDCNGRIPSWLAACTAYSASEKQQYVKTNPYTTALVYSVQAAQTAYTYFFILPQCLRQCMYVYLLQREHAERQ